MNYSSEPRWFKIRPEEAKTSRKASQGGAMVGYFPALRVIGISVCSMSDTFHNAVGKDRAEKRVFQAHYYALRHFSGEGAGQIIVICVPNHVPDGPEKVFLSEAINLAVRICESLKKDWILVGHVLEPKR